MTTREVWDDIGEYAGRPGYQIVKASDSAHYIVAQLKDGRNVWADVWEIDECDATQRQIDALDRAIRLRENWVKKHPCPTGPVRICDLKPGGKPLPHFIGGEVHWTLFTEDDNGGSYKVVWRQPSMTVGVAPNSPDEIWWTPLPNSSDDRVLVGGMDWFEKQSKAEPEESL